MNSESIVWLSQLSVYGSTRLLQNHESNIYAKSYLPKLEILVIQSSKKMASEIKSSIQDIQIGKITTSHTKSSQSTKSRLQSLSRT